MGLFDKFKKKATLGDNLKTISYRGGVVTFQIPSTWIEEYEEQGGGTFYEDSPDSGTFRLNVMTFKTPQPSDQERAIEALQTGDWSNKKISKLNNGNAISHYFQPSEEDGQRLLIVYWEIANPLPPEHVRLAVFSYTILETQKDDPKLMKEIELLDNCIRKAIFSEILGK